MSSIPERTAHPIEERELAPPRVGSSELELTRLSSSSDDSYHSATFELEAPLIEGLDGLRRGFYPGSTSEIQTYESPARVSEFPARAFESPYYSVGSEPEAALIEGSDGLQRGFYPGSTSEIQPYESPARVSEVPARASELPARVYVVPARASEAPERGPFHRPEATLVEVTDVITNPSWVHTIILGLQHALVALGGIMFAAEFANANLEGGEEEYAILLQTMLFTTGLNSLLQTSIGCRLPVVMGPSLSYLLSIQSVAEMEIPQSVTDQEVFGYRMRAVQGSLICSSAVTIVIGYSGAWEVLRFITPLTIFPIVSVMGISYSIKEFSQIAKCWVYGGPTFLATVVCQYLKRLHPLCQSILTKFASIICMGILWLVAGIMTLAGVHGILDRGSCPVDQHKILSSARWVYFPHPLQWGTPIFRGSYVVWMFGAALASSAEFTGSLFVVSRLAGATLPPCRVISRATGLQGIGQLLNGLWGVPYGPTTSVSNVGILASTRVGSRRVIQVSSVWMILLSFGKFGAFFATIPFPIFAASRIVSNGIAVSTSLMFLQFVNINSLRNLWVLAVSLSVGIGVPAYSIVAKKGLIDTQVVWFNTILGTILACPPMVAGVVGMFLDNTFQADDQDGRGIPWWVPFQTFSRDPRSLHFYALPDTLHRWTASLRINGRNLRDRWLQRFGSY